MLHHFLIVIFHKMLLEFSQKYCKIFTIFHNSDRWNFIKNKLLMRARWECRPRPAPTYLCPHLHPSLLYAKKKCASPAWSHDLRSCRGSFVHFGKHCVYWSSPLAHRTWHRQGKEMHPPTPTPVLVDALTGPFLWKLSNLYVCHVWPRRPVTFVWSRKEKVKLHGIFAAILPPPSKICNIFKKK